MKRFLFLIALIATSTAALATYQTPTTPPAGPTDIDATLKQQQEQQSRSDASATGIGLGGTSDADAEAKSYGGGAAINDHSSTRMLVFPAPVWSTVPEARTCIATNSQAHAIGWNFWSHSNSEQKSDPACIGVLMARSAYANCHFLSEALITQRVYATMFPGAPELPLAPELRNLSLAECEELKKPKLTMSHSFSALPAPVVAPMVAPVACMQPASKAPAARRVVKAKPKAARCDS